MTDLPSNAVIGDPCATASLKDLVISGANFPETLDMEQIRDLALGLATLILTPAELNNRINTDR